MLFILFLIPLFQMTLFSYAVALQTTVDFGLPQVQVEQGPVVARPAKNLVVVFIHGTIVALPSFSSLGDTFKRIFTDAKATSSFYDEYLYSLRTKSLFRMQPIGDYGLWQVMSDASTHATPAARLAWFYKQLYKDVLPPDYSALQFYTFGWPGKLDLAHRAQWAKSLYDGLLRVVESHKRRGRALDIMLVAHSHGGNVALHLADYYQQGVTPFTIKKLVLLGTPVFVESEECVRSPIFDLVYSLYSNSDTLQVSDIISSKKGYARRTFGTHKGFEQLPPNLQQINISVAGRQPYHVELWAFPHEGGLMFYREYLSIYPFPVALFAPVITALADQAGSLASNSVVDIRKDGVGYSYLLQLEAAKKMQDQFKQYSFALAFNDIASRCGIMLNE